MCLKEHISLYNIKMFMLSVFKLVSQNFCLRKLYVVLIYIAYMCINFMLSVSCIEELDNSSLCGTRV